MQEQFFIFGALYDYNDSMFADAIALPNCHYTNKKTCLKNPIAKAMYKIHNSGIANKLVKIPKKNLWYKYLFNAKYINRGGGSHFVFLDSNPHVYSPDFLKWIRNKVPNSTLTCIFMNSMKYRKFGDMDYFREHFDLLYTIDGVDAEKYEMTHIPTIHSKQECYCNSEVTQRYDIFFAGADKGRGKYLKEYFAFLKKKELKPKFTVINVEEPPEGMDTERIPHKEILRITSESKAILEWVPEGANILTLRFAEAIMYNKILITNSSAVKQTRFSENDSIYYFENPEDILQLDVDFDKKTDYGYNGEFSPLRILSDISARVGDKTQYC